MLRIRLSRVGKKKQPAYRLIVTDSRSPRDGAFLKIIGHYNPLTDPATLVVKEEEAVHWLEKGAKPSETAAKLLTRIGVMERAGRPAMRYEGKVAPAAPKKEAKAAPSAPAGQPKAKAAKEQEPTAAVKVPDAVEDEAEEPPAEGEAAPEAEPEAAEEPEPETKEPEPKPEATSEEQPQEQAESQE